MCPVRGVRPLLLFCLVTRGVLAWVPGRFPEARCLGKEMLSLGAQRMVLAPSSSGPSSPPCPGRGCVLSRCAFLGDYLPAASCLTFSRHLSRGGPGGPLFGCLRGMFPSALPCCTIVCAYCVAGVLLPCLEHLVLGEPVDGEHTLGPVLGHLLWPCWGTGMRHTFTRGGSPIQDMGDQMYASAQGLGGHKLPP